MDEKADERLPVVGVVFLVRLKGARNNRRRNLKRSSDAAKQMLASSPPHTPRAPVRFKHIGLIAAQRSHASHAASPPPPFPRLLLFGGAALRLLAAKRAKI